MKPPHADPTDDASVVESVRNSSMFFAGPSTTTVAMAAAADALLSHNGSFASRFTGLTGADGTYLPVPSSGAPPADISSPSKAATTEAGKHTGAREQTAADDTDSVFSRRDEGTVGRDKVVRGEKATAATGYPDSNSHVHTGDDECAAFSREESVHAGDGGDDGTNDDKSAKPKPTPLPIGQILIIGSVLLTESLSGMMLMPFVGLFVAHLMDWTVEKAGYLSGVLVGMFMLGQVLSGKLWGYISDRHGRKKPLVVGLAVGAAMMFVFGISPNIYIACAARFIHGFFNGTVLIAKTVVSDITDNSNRAKGFAWVSLAWAIGSLVGPTIGGFLYDPATNSKFASYNISANSFLGQYPAFLPATVLAAYIAFSFVLCVVFLKESNPTDRSALELIPAPLRRCLARCGCSRLAVPHDEQTADSKSANNNDAPVLNEEEVTHADDGGSGSDRCDGNVREAHVPSPDSAAAPRDTSSETAVALTDGEEEVIADKFTYMDAIRYPPSRYLLILFMLYCALEIIYSEVMPLWAVAKRDVGGLGLFSDDVAILLLVCGAPALVANLVFPLLCDRVFAHNKMLFWQLSITINAVCTAIIPVAAYVHGNRGGFWFTLALGLVRQFGLSWCFGLAQYLVPYVAKKGHVGTMFGINQAAGSATRCVIPFGAAPLFAWSISGRDRPFPINHFLLFMICVLCAIATFVISFFLKLPIEVAFREERRARKLRARQDEEAQQNQDVGSGVDADEPLVLDGQELADKEER